MTIHLSAVHDFPQDCNAREADLLRRELGYYIYRRISRTRVTVHLEDFSPTVPYPEVLTFFDRVFGDLIRLERLNPQRIQERLRLTARRSENAELFKKDVRNCLHKAFFRLDRAAYRAALFRYFTVDSRTGRHVYHYRTLLPNAPGQARRGHEPHPVPHAPETPQAPRLKMHKRVHGPQQHLPVHRPPTPHPEILYTQAQTPHQHDDRRLEMHTDPNENAAPMRASRMPGAYYRLQKRRNQRPPTDL